MKKMRFLILILLVFTFCENPSKKKSQKAPVFEEEMNAFTKTDKKAVEKNLAQKWITFELKNDTIFQEIKISKKSEDTLDFLFETEYLESSQKNILRGVAYLNSSNIDGSYGYGTFYDAKMDNYNCSFIMIIIGEYNYDKYVSFDNNSNCLGIVKDTHMRKDYDISNNNPLCILNNTDFNIVYVSIKNKLIDVLHYS